MESMCSFSHLGQASGREGVLKRQLWKVPAQAVASVVLIGKIVQKKSRQS